MIRLFYFRGKEVNQPEVLNQNAEERVMKAQPNDVVQTYKSCVYLPYVFLGHSNKLQLPLV